MHPIPRVEVAGLMIGASWRERASCRGIDYPEIFNAPARKDDALYMQALALCRGCPVRDQCFDWASADRAFEGVAAGKVWHCGRRETVSC